MKRKQIPNRIPKEDRGCRMEKPLRFIYAVCIVCIAALCTGAFADSGDETRKETSANSAFTLILTGFAGN